MTRIQQLLARASAGLPVPPSDEVLREDLRRWMIEQLMELSRDE
jgi:hypothetical protein